MEISQPTEKFLSGFLYDLVTGENHTKCTRY